MRELWEREKEKVEKKKKQLADAPAASLFGHFLITRDIIFFSDHTCWKLKQENNAQKISFSYRNTKKSAKMIKSQQETKKFYFLLTAVVKISRKMWSALRIGSLLSKTFLSMRVKLFLSMLSKHWNWILLDDKGPKMFGIPISSELDLLPFSTARTQKSITIFHNVCFAAVEEIWSWLRHALSTWAFSTRCTCRKEKSYTVDTAEQFLCLLSARMQVKKQ